MGGFAGHMSHIYDINEIKFTDIFNIINQFKDKKINSFTEKLDGLNIFASINKNGEITFARNKTDIKSGGFTYIDIQKRWYDKPNIAIAYQFAYKTLASALQNIKTLINKNYQIWLNCEVLHNKAINVIPYNKNMVSIHNITAYDNNLRQINIKQKTVHKIYNNILWNDNIQKTNTVLFNDNFMKFYKPSSVTTINKIDTLLKKYNLCKTNTIKDFKQKALFNYIKQYNPFNLNSIFINENDELTKLLINRWLFNDKIINLKYIKSLIKKTNEEYLTTFNLIKSSDITKIKNDSLSELSNIFRKYGNLFLIHANNNMNHNNDNNISYKISNKLSIINPLLLNYVIPRTIEGVVFKYKKYTIKLTGDFPIINDVLSTYKNY